jgi:hypothetical protein
MKAAVIAVIAVGVLLLASAARGQSIAAELDVTSGYSTQRVAAAATQLRVFGDVPSGVRFFLEGAWAARDDDANTDVFGAAYPYNKRVQVIEAYGERIFRPGRGLFAVRAGRFRSPFGISGRSDHAYSGFLRAPLIRYDGYYALSNNYLEHGADVMAGVPQLYAEASLGTPGDVGIAKRRSGLDRIFRVQGYHGPFIVGVSHSRTLPYMPVRFAKGDAVFTGVDVRWMRGGVQLRGEWIAGRPFNGTTTDGGYVDLIVHRPGMGPLTAVARVERSDYEAAPPRASHARRYTAGGRIRLFGHLTAQIALIHQSGRIVQAYRNALDLGLTYSIRQ